MSGGLLSEGATVADVVSPTNLQLIGGWEDALRAVSPKMRYLRQRHLLAFAAKLADRSLLAAEEQHVDDWLAAVAQSETGRRDRVASLVRFYQWASSEALAHRDPVVRKPWVPDDAEPPANRGLRGSFITGSWDWLVAQYLRARRAEGLDPRTLEQFRSRLRDFTRCAPAKPAKITREHIVDWLNRPEVSPAYLRSRLSTARGFMQWCVLEGYVPKDPTAGIKTPRVVEGVPKKLNPVEVVELVTVASGDVRTLLVVLLMLQEGLRRIEIARLEVQDIDFAERTIEVRGKGGQGRRTAVLPITDETWSVLQTYLAEEGHRSGPLVRNRVRKHGRMAPNTISQLVHDAMIDAGIKKPGDTSKTPHSLRHTCAHDLLSRTKDVRSVQQALRHVTVRSTEIYLRGQVGDLRGVMGGRRYRVDHPAVG